MVLTTAQAFARFEERIEPSDYHYSTRVPARVESAADNLERAFDHTCDMPFEMAEVMGSVAKRTAVAPIDDIDVLAVFTDAGALRRYRGNAQQFLYRVRNAYQGSSVQAVGSRGQAVRVFFQHGGYVDVAPVFRAGLADTFYLPAGNGDWIQTRPFVANAWFARRNRELSYNLARLVMLLKKWNGAHSKRLSSFHLETVAGNVFRTLGSNMRNGLDDFFSWSQSNLNVSDPGGCSGDLASGMSYSTRSEVIQSLRTASARSSAALRAENAGNHDEARRLWTIILGDQF